MWHFLLLLSGKALLLMIPQYEPTCVLMDRSDLLHAVRRKMRKLWTHTRINSFRKMTAWIPNYIIILCSYLMDRINKQFWLFVLWKDVLPCQRREETRACWVVRHCIDVQSSLYRIVIQKGWIRLTPVRGIEYYSSTVNPWRLQRPHFLYLWVPNTQCSPSHHIGYGHQQEDSVFASALSFNSEGCSFFGCLSLSLFVLLVCLPSWHRSCQGRARWWNQNPRMGN